MTKWLSILLCLVGLGVGAYVVATSGEKPPSPPPAAPPSVNPYINGIAATGTIEARSRNIVLAPPIGGLVLSVAVEVNDHVEAGQELFKLDARELEAQRLRFRAAVDTARARLDMLKGQPRPEDLPPLRAAVSAAAARLADVEDWYDTLTKARAGQVVSSSELTRAKFSLDAAKAELRVAEANLARTEAGAWAPEIEVAQATVAGARADLEAADMLIERMTVRAPISGVVLKRNIDPGRFASADPTTAALVIGDLTTLRVRAQVDEEDMPRLAPGAVASARVRGADEVVIDLRMVRIEPFAAPKTTLTGSVVERVDTRVVDVLFELAPGSRVALYPGQVVDVYIKAEAEAGGGGEAGDAGGEALPPRP